MTDEQAKIIAKALDGIASSIGWSALAVYVGLVFHSCIGAG